MKKQPGKERAMKGKKDKQSVDDKVIDSVSISTPAELRSFLTSVRDKMMDEVAAPIYGLVAIEHVLNIEGIYQLLDEENKLLAREIWLRLKKAGIQLKNPPLLFKPEEEQSGSLYEAAR